MGLSNIKKVCKLISRDFLTLRNLEIIMQMLTQETGERERKGERKAAFWVGQHKKKKKDRQKDVAKR